MEANDRPIIHLSDEELLAGLRRLARRDQEITAALLAHLAEFDRRKLYLDAGCTSLWAYCLDVLRMGEGEAGKRIAAARAGRDYPMIFDLVATGQLHLSAVSVLWPKLTRENHVDLLQESVHKTKRQVEELVAARFPQPDAPSLIRKLPSPPEASPESLPLFAAGPEPAAPAPAPPPAAAPAAPAATPVPRRATVTPTAADRYKVQFTATTALRDKLREAQALLRHAIPDGTWAPSSSAQSTRCSPSCAAASSPRPGGRAGARRTSRRRKARGTSLIPSSARSPNGTTTGARSWRPTAGAAVSAGSSNSTTTTRGGEEDRRRQPTFDFYVALTMPCSPGVTTASAISNSDAPTRSSPAADGRRMDANEGPLSRDCAQERRSALRLLPTALARAEGSPGSLAARRRRLAGAGRRRRAERRRGDRRSRRPWLAPQRLSGARLGRLALIRAAARRRPRVLARRLVRRGAAADPGHGFGPRREAPDAVAGWAERPRSAQVESSALLLADLGPATRGR